MLFEGRDRDPPRPRAVTTPLAQPVPDPNPDVGAYINPQKKDGDEMRYHQESLQH